LGRYLLLSSICFNKFLMQDGMQWEIFLKFLAKLEEHCEIVLVGSEIDYRRLISQRSIDQVRD
jgi:predicted ATPase